MPRRIRGMGVRRRVTFLRQWRKKAHPTLSQAAVAERFGMSEAQLSRIETGESPYTQDFLELAAEDYATDVASLLMRDPSDPEAIWSLWDTAKPGQRKAIVEHAKVIVRTGS